MIKATKVDLRSVRVDLKAEKDGEWVDSTLIPLFRIYTRSLNDPTFRSKQAKIRRDLERSYPMGGVPADIEAREIGTLIADYLLLGWSGATEEYSPDIARELLTAPDMRLLREAALLAAAEVGQREIKYVEEDAKN